MIEITESGQTYLRQLLAKQNCERDFKQGSWVPFVIAGLLFTAAFVFALVFVVKMVLAG